MVRLVRLVVDIKLMVQVVLVGEVEARFPKEAKPSFSLAPV